MPLDIMNIGLLIAEAAGALSSLLVARRLFRVYSVVRDPSMSFMAASFAILGLALLLELAGNTAGMAGVGVGKGRPVEVSLILANSGVMIASPLYIISYTLYALALYLEHVPIQQNRVFPMLAPLVYEVYIDNNIVSLILLAISAYLIATRGNPNPSLGLLISLLGLSHVFLIVAALLLDSSLMLAGLLLRALAPVVFASITLIEGRRG